MTDAVLLNSGGLDSRVTAAIARNLGHTLHSVFVDYNNETREVAAEAAAETARLYCETHRVYPVLVDWMRALNNGWFGLPFMAPFVHLIGAQYAVYLGVEYVWSGHRRDARQEDYAARLQDLIRSVNLTRPVSFCDPLSDTASVAETVTKAREMGVEVETTYSCNRYPPCGECRKCVGRREFAL